MKKLLFALSIFLAIPLTNVSASGGAYSSFGLRTGTATLVDGSVTVSNTNVTSTSRIIPVHKTFIGAPGELAIENVVSGTSFDIVSSSSTDNSTVTYTVIEAQ